MTIKLINVVFGGRKFNRGKTISGKRVQNENHKITESEQNLIAKSILVDIKFIFLSLTWILGCKEFDTVERISRFDMILNTVANKNFPSCVTGSNKLFIAIESCESMFLSENLKHKIVRQINSWISLHVTL